VTDRRTEIDEHIVKGRILPALMILGEEFGHTIHEAIDAFSVRYEELRSSRPDDFTVPRQEYGKGVYT
jgi:hypothetical protein